MPELKTKNEFQILCSDKIKGIKFEERVDGIANQ